MMRETLQKIIRETLSIPADVVSITPLHGEASTRIYSRLQLTNGKSFIVMQLPPGPTSASEEITNLKQPGQELPFLNVAQYLKNQALPVPEVYHYDEKEKFLILEDFGDETLEKRVRSHPEEKELWYKKAIDLLVDFQVKTEKATTCVAFHRSFDKTLLDWELDHFWEYGVEIRQNKKSVEAKNNFEKLSRPISDFLTKIPTVLTHRDYQSRNLMVYEGQLEILDFQDALIGPLPYDLVALLRDSYIVLEKELLERLIQHYLKKREEAKHPLEAESFRKMFDWVTIHRKLKDAGRFIYIDKVKKNSSFLPSIPASLAYVKTAFERQPELNEFFNFLKKYVPEFS
ncbi:MAG: phosphotransferase [Deltaproteobacteria bacterium]|nr:phosphotransferase [Deltaproteobacteria bacterium]